MIVARRREPPRPLVNDLYIAPSLTREVLPRQTSEFVKVGEILLDVLTSLLDRIDTAGEEAAA